MTDPKDEVRARLYTLAHCARKEWDAHYGYRSRPYRSEGDVSHPLPSRDLAGLAEALESIADQLAEFTDEQLREAGINRAPVNEPYRFKDYSP